MYNIVLIGCGHMGMVYLDNISGRDDVCLYGIVDTMEERAKQCAKRYGADIIWSKDYMQFMQDENVDIIICAAYPSMFLSVLKQCAKFGKHLLCEKPIATSLEDGAEFVSIVKSSEIKVLIGYILRHTETYNIVAKMISEGAVGSPMVLRMTQNHHTINWEKYRNLILESSPIIDCGVHYIDICRWFTGAEITDIGGIALRTEPDIPEDKYNYGMINLKLSDGSVAYYEAGWGKTFSSDNVKEFTGQNGRIRIVLRENRFSNREEGDLIEYYDRKSKTYKTINVPCERKPTGAELDHLIAMIERGAPANPTIEDVYTSFEIAVRADAIIKNKDYGGNSQC